MTQQTPLTVYRQDYSAPKYLTDEITLTFQLNQDDTLVTARSFFMRNPDQSSGDKSLFLDGQCLELVSVSLDSTLLTALEYSLTASGILIHSVPDTFVFEITTRIFPDRNTELEGLFRSSGISGAKRIRGQTSGLFRRESRARLSTSRFSTAAPETRTSART